MNIRSLTRGDGVVIGAAVLLFIASFLDNFSYDELSGGVDMPNLWESGPVLLSVVLAGLIAAALVVTARALPQPRKVAGLELGVFGVAFAVFAAWSALGNVIDPIGGLDNIASGSKSPSAGTGLILALVATLLMAAAAVATPLVPALQAALIPAPKPAAPQPYGAQPPQGYGYPGAPAAVLRRSAAAGPGVRAAAPRRALRRRSAGGRGLLAVLVRRAGGPPAVRGGRFAEPGRRTGPRHLVPGGRAARCRARRADPGRPSRCPPGHLGHPARLSPRTVVCGPSPLPGGGPSPFFCR